MEVIKEIGPVRLIRMNRYEYLSDDAKSRVTAIIEAERKAILDERERWRIASDERVRRRLHWARSPLGRFVRFFTDHAYRSAVLRNI